MPRTAKPLRWIASSRKDYREFPEDVQVQFGFELFLAQTGQHPPSAPLNGLGSGVVELIEDFDGDTYRAGYAVRFATAIYVLHAFKKKSKRGIKSSPQNDIDLIKQRLKDAEADNAAQFNEAKKR